MFEHSVKVPRHFKVAAGIFEKVSTEGGSVKTLLYDNKLRHFRTNVIYALVSETIKHAADIDKIFEHFKILETEQRMNPWLAKTLTAELLFGKKTLPGVSKPEKTILSYKEQFEKYLSEHQDELEPEVPRRPRYVRINTNLLTTSDAVRVFQDEGYRFIRCTSGSYDDYIEQIRNLKEDEFTQDYHVKTIYVFPSGTKMHEHEMYLESKFILQDKATAMAVHLLAPPKGSVILDMCAAPGMKTSQVAAYIRNSGKVYAVERNLRRYETLCEFIKKTDCNCVEPINKDVLEIKRGQMDDVEYILLDPSCSGSGMQLSVHSYSDPSRLEKLTSLQEKFLKHAMNAFPAAKRIVYSTCSLFPEENERVIANVVKTSRAKWRVQSVEELLKGQWKNYGSGMYGSIGPRCLYARPESDLTTGFFLAVIDRDMNDYEKTMKAQKKANEEEKSKSNSQSSEADAYEKDNDIGVDETAELQDEVQIDENKPKKKKKKKDKHRDVNEHTEDSENVEVVSKKSKRKHSNENASFGNVTDNLNDLSIDEVQVSKKKKKHKHAKIEENNLNTNDVEDTPRNDVENTTPDDGEVSKKKKKRKKNIEDNESQIQEQQTESELIPKKRKKVKNVT